MQTIINKHICPNMLNSVRIILFAGGFSNLGALSKFQVRDPNTITIMLFYAQPLFCSQALSHYSRFYSSLNYTEYNQQWNVS